MRWLAVGFAIIIGLALILAAVFLLPPPTSGIGWRLDESGGRYGRPLMGDIEPTIVMYAAETSDEVGFGVTVYDSSSCPPELRDVQVGADGVRVEVNADPVFGGCTADAGTTGTTSFKMREEYSGPLLGMIWKSIPDLGPSFDTFATGLKSQAERGS